MLIKTHHWPPQQKPGPGSEVDWGHPLSRGLVGCWLFNEGAGCLARDIAACNHGSLINFNGTATSGWMPTIRGLGLAFDGTDDYISTAFANFTNQMTYSSLVFRRDQSTPDAIFSGSEISKSPMWRMEAGSNNIKFWPDVTETSSAWTNAGTVATWCHASVIFQQDIDSVSLFVNGVRLGAVSQTKNYNATPGKLWIGARYTTDYFNGLIAYFAIHARALSPDEVRWLHAEPYAMIRPAGPPRRYFTVSALDQVFRTREQPQRFRLRELGPRFRLTEKRP